MTKKLLLVLMILLVAKNYTGAAKPKAESDSQSRLQIELRRFGYQKPKPAYPSDKTVSSNPRLLMEDLRSRLSFVGDNSLVVYFSRPLDKPVDTRKSEGTANTMEAFFLNVDAGTLIARRTWNTVKRQWFNDSYDTQGRTMEVRDGFLVRAGTKLELYSSGMQLLRSYELHDDGSGAVKAWSVAVAPGGNTIHIQPSKGPAEVRHSSVFHFTGGDETEGVWLRSDSFQKVYSQMDLPGPHSVSDNAVATRRVHCLELHSVGEPPRSLCCSGACGDGIPTFLSNHEILSVYRSGFSVLSTNGNELWNRNAAGSKGLDLEDQARSMNGLRFAISATSSEDATLDGVLIARSPEHTILVYDSHCRERVFAVTAKADPSDFAFGLSREGRNLAVLTGTSVTLYRLNEGCIGGVTNPSRSAKSQH